MTKATPTRKKSWRTVAGSLVTLLALLVTPFCAPLCAAQTCPQSTLPAASKEHCHGAASMHDDVPQIHAALNCNPSELTLAALSAGNESDLLRVSRSAPQAASDFAASREFDSGFISPRNNFSSNPGPLRPPDPFSATGVLRI